MKNFRLYALVGNREVLVTKSQDSSHSSTYDENVEFNEYQQINFSCKIIKYLDENETLNQHYNLFYPEALLRLKTYDFNDNLLTCDDLIIKECTPQFYEKNVILSVSAIDYASERFSKRGANLIFEETGNIKELAIKLFAESGVNTRYIEATKNLISEFNLVETQYGLWTPQGIICNDTEDTTKNIELLFDFTNQLNKINYNFTFYPILMNDGHSDVDVIISMLNSNKETIREVRQHVKFNLLNEINIDNSNDDNSDGNIPGTELLNDNSINFIKLTFIRNQPFTHIFAEENKHYTGTEERETIGTLPLNPIKIILKEVALFPSFQLLQDFWRLDPNFVPNDFITITDDTNTVFTRATLSLNGSNFYNGLIELCKLFDAEITFDYINRYVSFKAKSSNTYKGIRFSPNINLKDFSRKASSSELYTIIDVYGGENNNVQINLIPSIPKHFKEYFWSCIEHDFDEDHFKYFTDNNNYETIAQELIKNLTEEEKDLYENDILKFGKILNLVPNFENRLYDITYFYNIGKISENSYTLFQDIINNQLRKINIKTFLFSEQYSNLKSLLISLESEISFLSENIVTEQQWRNSIYDNLEKYLLRNKLIENNTTWKTRESIASANKNIANYEEQLDTVYGINDDIKALDNNHLLFVLLQLYGYISLISNCFIDKKIALQELIFENQNELTEALDRIRDIVLELNAATSDWQKRNLEVEQAGLTRQIKNYYKQLGKKNSYETFIEWIKEEKWENMFKTILGEYNYNSLKDYNFMVMNYYTPTPETPLAPEQEEQNLYVENIVKFLSSFNLTVKRVYGCISLKEENDNHDGYLQIQLDKLLEIENKYNEEDGSAFEGYSNYFDNYYHENNLLRQKNIILEELFKKFSPYLIEGYYENSDEINSYDLAEQAMVIRNSMIYPKISYDLTVIDLSSIEDYQFMNFKVGDKIKIENKEMFLEYNRLLDNFLVIAGIKYNLRNLGDTQLIINKDNEDEYLLQKLFLGLLK